MWFLCFKKHKNVFICLFYTAAYSANNQPLCLNSFRNDGNNAEGHYFKMTNLTYHNKTKANEVRPK